MNINIYYDVIWRSGAGDTVIATFYNQFTAPTGDAQFGAVAYEADLPGMAVPAKAGDLLVLRFRASGIAVGTAFIPNGDGANSKGRIPSIRLPASL